MIEHLRIRTTSDETSLPRPDKVTLLLDVVPADTRAAIVIDTRNANPKRWWPTRTIILA